MTRRIQRNLFLALALALLLSAASGCMRYVSYESADGARVTYWSTFDLKATEMNVERNPDGTAKLNAKDLDASSKWAEFATEMAKRIPAAP